MSKGKSGSMAAPVGKMNLAQGKNDGFGDHYKVITAGPHGKGVHAAHDFMMGGAGPNVLASSGKSHKGKNTLKGID